MAQPYSLYFPEMALTLVRRSSAKLPRNNYILRTEPKWTKPEIQHYLEALYGVQVERIATVNYLGKVRRRRGLRPYTRLRDFKKVYVRLAEDSSDVFQRS